MKANNKTYRVLFLCTGNSARSQIAEAVLNRKGRGRFVAESAGSNPAAKVNPYAVHTLRDSGSSGSAIHRVDSAASIGSAGMS